MINALQLEEVDPLGNASVPVMIDGASRNTQNHTGKHTLHVCLQTHFTFLSAKLNADDTKSYSIKWKRDYIDMFHNKIIQQYKIKTINWYIFPVAMGFTKM